MECKEPLTCAERSLLWERIQEQSAAQMELEMFQEVIEEGNAILAISIHASGRQLDRSFSKPQIAEAVKYGWAIERRWMGEEVTITVMYHLRVSARVYRPIHVIAVFHKTSPNKWTVKTVYDPRSEAWKWSEDFQRRICFCK